MGVGLPETRLGRADRILAACLAGVWLAGGALALVLGTKVRPAVLPVVLGVLALGYGWLWARVALTGRRQGWRVGRGRRGRAGR